jgi:hypothetical protein
MVYIFYFRLCGLVRVPGYRPEVPGSIPLSLVSTIEELLGRNSSGSGLKNQEYGRGDPLRWPRDILYPQKLALTLPTSGDRSFGIVRLRTKATEFVLFCTTFIWYELLSSCYTELNVESYGSKNVLRCICERRLSGDWLIVVRMWSNIYTSVWTVNERKQPSNNIYCSLFCYI